VSVDLAVGWWSGSAEQLEDEVFRALESVGGQREGASLTLRLDARAQRQLRREAQMIRNRSMLARNDRTMHLMATQVRDVRRWVLRTRADIRRSQALAHIA
jgi:hypothetical protein